MPQTAVDNALPRTHVVEELFQSQKEAEASFVRRANGDEKSQHGGLNLLGSYFGVIPKCRRYDMGSQPTFAPCAVFEFAQQRDGGARVIWGLGENYYQVEDFSDLDDIQVLDCFLFFHK